MKTSKFNNNNNSTKIIKTIKKILMINSPLIIFNKIKNFQICNKSKEINLENNIIIYNKNNKLVCNRVNLWLVFLTKIM